jgi:peptide/nickel transport system ATP-binding protein
MSEQNILEVDGLHTWFETKKGTIKAVDDVSFALKPGEILGLVGESGSGKSITGLSILGLIDPPGKIVKGAVRYRGRDLVGLPERELRSIRGRNISMIFQDPMMTLNPVLRIDTQMHWALAAHGKVDAKTARARSLEVLKLVGIASPEERLSSYPHELSGGMRQRIAIAIAMLNRPDILIADEATTALDVTIQSQILSEMQQLCAETGTALIWITHDLSVVAGLADRVCVMYAGKIVEQGRVDDVLDRPRHHYTAGLISSVPSMNARGAPLQQISGMTPSLFNLPSGCAFRARCPAALAACASPVPLNMDGAHQFRCINSPVLAP